MKIKRLLGLCILILILISIFPFPIFKLNPVSAKPDKLSWTVVKTPSHENNFIVPSEINFIAIGPDNLTLYALDIPHRKLYRSSDNGMTWVTSPGDSLLAKAGLNTRIWNIAIAPDNTNYIVAVTSSGGADGPPLSIYVSEDGGNNWVDTQINTSGENISCIDVSPVYSENKRFLVAGTRTLLGTGNIYLNPGGLVANWSAQTTYSWTPADVIVAKFSPNFTADNALAVIISTNSATYVNLGWIDIADVNSDKTHWDYWYTTPPGREIKPSGGTSPSASSIVTADIEFPSDFEPNYNRIMYVCYDDNLATGYAGIYRINNADNERIFSTNSNPERIYSIAYYGTTQSGSLLAGTVAASDVTETGYLYIITVSYSNNLITHTRKNAAKPPTGGANPVPGSMPARYRCNMQLAFNPDGTRAYCGTSSADLDQPAGPTSGWPNGFLNSVDLDESAFSVSPFSAEYQNRMAKFNKNTGADTQPGNIWNQIGLIDTEISRFSDVAVLEVASSSKSDYNILYLASINTNSSPLLTRTVDSIWRSTHETLGTTWERVFTHDTDNNAIILRVYKGSSYLTRETRSNKLVMADRYTKNIRLSEDEGQSWAALLANIEAHDIALENEKTIYVADDFSVRRGNRQEAGWLWESPIFTGLDSTHTLYILPEDAQATNPRTNRKERWMVVGDESTGQVAYCDFGAISPRFELIPRQLPEALHVHVFLHDRFSENKLVFAAVVDSTGNLGRIYRWTLGMSEDWLDLQCLNRAFYGVGLDRDTLYAVWNNPVSTTDRPGVDRTLYSIYTPPPPLEWDDLTWNLPKAGDANYPVSFTCEPSALKISTNDNNTLWAIDNRDYDWDNRTGCLWYYVDTLAKRGPWSTNPPGDSIVEYDPVTGRAGQINFKWFQLEDAGAYELQIAKDPGFSQRVINQPVIVPHDQTSPAWILPAGSVLEVSHRYYWRVRAIGSIEGERIHSPWSATMYFTVMTGLPVETEYYGPRLLSPVNNCGCPCNAPVSFSWSPFKNTDSYIFELSENADMSSPLIYTAVNTTAYKYNGKLKCNTSYFWRVRADKPFPSDWSATFSFTTQPEKQVAPKTTATPSDRFVIPVAAIISMIVIFAFLFFFIIVLIVKTRHIPGTSTVWQSVLRDVEPLTRIPRRKTSEKSKIDYDVDDEAYNGVSLKQRLQGWQEKLIMWWRRRRYLTAKPDKNRHKKFFHRGE